MTLRGTYTFTPTLTLQAYAQLFLAWRPLRPARRRSPAPATHPLLPLGGFQPAGDAAPGGSPDFREGAINVNLVLRWEYLPGSALIGVYTHASGQTPFDPPTEGSGACASAGSRTVRPPTCSC